MKTYSKDINVYCDVQKSIYCWGEGSVTLQWSQGKKVAFKIFKSDGWSIGMYADVCPYCSKGIKQTNCTVDKTEIDLIKNADKNGV